MLRGDVTWTIYPADLYAVSETTLDPGLLSSGNHLHGHMYFEKEFLCSHSHALSFIVHLGLELLLSENFFPLQILLCLNMPIINCLASDSQGLIQPG